MTEFISISANDNPMTTPTPFQWKFLNVLVVGKTTERHYKCQNTGAYKCAEYKYGGQLKGISYCLPNSDDYNITSEDHLLKLLNQ